MGYHSPVLLIECIEGLNIKPTGIYVDVTFGGGGHSKLILDNPTADNLVDSTVFQILKDKKTVSYLKEKAQINPDTLQRGELSGDYSYKALLSDLKGIPLAWSILMVSIAPGKDFSD